MYIQQCYLFILMENVTSAILHHRKRMWFILLTIDSLRSSAYILATRSWSIWWSLGWTLFLQYTMYFFSRSWGTVSTVEVVFSECCKQRGSLLSSADGQIQYKASIGCTNLNNGTNVQQFYVNFERMIVQLTLWNWIDLFILFLS